MSVYHLRDEDGFFAESNPPFEKNSKSSLALSAAARAFREHRIIGLDPSKYFEVPRFRLTEHEGKFYVDVVVLRWAADGTFRELDIGNAMDTAVVSDDGRRVRLLFHA